jgi:CBS domain-containing protein
MKLGDIMTRNVIAVPPDTPALAVARLLADRGISAVPVTDSWNMLLGIVSEADLIHRLAVSDTPTGGFLHALFYDRDRAAQEYARAHGATAADVMTHEADLITATEDTTAEHAALLIEQHKVRRLPVLRDGLLVGIVSRADLLRALLVPPAAATDAEIRTRVAGEIGRLPWADAPYVFFDVQQAEVTLYGFCHSAAVREGLRALASATPGVARVTDRITDAMSNHHAI